MKDEAKKLDYHVAAHFRGYVYVYKKDEVDTHIRELEDKATEKMIEYDTLAMEYKELEEEIKGWKDTWRKDQKYIAGVVKTMQDQTLKILELEMKLKPKH